MLPLVTYMENQYILGSFQSVSMLMTLRVAVLAHGASRVGFDSSHRETGAGYIRFCKFDKVAPILKTSYRFFYIPPHFLNILYENRATLSNCKITSDNIHPLTRFLHTIFTYLTNLPYFNKVYAKKYQ